MKIWWLHMIKPAIAFALFTLAEIWSSNFRSESKVAPKPFSPKTCSSSLLEIVYRCVCFMFSNLPKVKMWHLSILNSSNHFFVHNSGESMSCCNAILSSLEVISRKFLVSSANRNVSEFMFSGQSLMYRTNRSSLRTLHWGILLSTSAGKESSPLTLTTWVHPLRKFPSIP